MKKIINNIFNDNSPPILVAEISANHNGSINTAKKLILTAKKNNADVVKLQTYGPNNMTIKSKKKDFIIKEGLWKGFQLWELYNKGQTPLYWQKELFDYAKKIKMPCFSTPYDDEGLLVLKKLNVELYKISSFEMKDTALIKKICKTKKPIIISTGLANLDEINHSYQTAIKSGCKKLILLYCVSSYPAKNEDFNLNNIEILKKKFNCPIGFSDHSINNSIAMMAISKGARVIEKHIALDDQKDGLDIDFSIKGKEIKKFKQDMINAWKINGKQFFFRNKNELQNKKFQRSIYATNTIKKGEKFSKKNIKRIRPGYSLPASYWEYVLKRRANKNYEIGSRILLKDLKN